MPSSSDDGSLTDNSDASEIEPVPKPSYASKIRNISYGDLAEAQADLPAGRHAQLNSRTSKPSTDLSQSEPSEKLQALRDRLAELKQENGNTKAKDKKHRSKDEDASSDSDDDAPHARSSKHAPTEQSSKRPVTRKRTITEVLANPTHARDPRFSAASGHVDTNATARRYKFLSEYRDGEIKDLKEEMKRTNNPEEKTRLRVLVGRMENRARVEKQREDEAQVLRQHRQQEREKVKQGKKPFFMKKGEVRKQVVEERFQELAPKAKERLLKRRQQKVAQREKRNMPDQRREQG